MTVWFTAKVNVVISAFAEKGSANFGLLKVHDRQTQVCRTKTMERAIGFEPMMNGSAVRRLRPLGYARF